MKGYAPCFAYLPVKRCVKHHIRYRLGLNIVKTDGNITVVHNIRSAPQSIFYYGIHMADPFTDRLESGLHRNACVMDDIYETGSEVDLLGFHNSKKIVETMSCPHHD